MGVGLHRIMVHQEGVTLQGGLLRIKVDTCPIDQLVSVQMQLL